MSKNTSTITVNNQPISVVTDTDRNNYICLTDMIRANEPDAERTGMILQNWMRRKDTIEYIGFWEMLSNPDFNVLEFEYIKNEAGTNRFVMTAKEWIARTNAIGIKTRALPIRAIRCSSQNGYRATCTSRPLQCRTQVPQTPPWK